MDLNGGMGVDGTLPWPYDKQDMAWFKKNTVGQIVVMGSNTWADVNMPTPLPNRYNVVVSDKHPDLFVGADKVIPRNDIEQELKLLEATNPNKDIFVIGGPTLLMAVRHLIHEALITLFQSIFDCDTFIDINSWTRDCTLQTQSYGRNKIFRTYACKIT